MPDGFFLATAGRDPDRPSPWMVGVYLGALAVGVVTIGVGLLVG